MKLIAKSFSLSCILLLGLGAQVSSGEDRVSDDQREQEPTSHELIVLVRDDAHSPSEIVQGFRDQREIFAATYGLVESARYLISSRKQISTLTPFWSGEPLDEFLREQIEFPALSPVHPDSPEAELQRYLVLTYASEEDLALAEISMKNSEHIESVSGNLRGKFMVTPNDPLLDIPASGQWGMFRLSLEDAWDKVTGHAYLGIPDSGIDIDHPDLIPNYRSQFSVNLVPGGTPQSNTIYASPGHGTHVSGISAAATDNSEGVSGVCWDCSISFARISTSGAVLAESLVELSDMGVQAINASWAVAGSEVWTANECDDPAPAAAAFCAAMISLTLRDIPMAAAAGNGDDDLNLDPHIGDPQFSEGRSDFIQFPASDPRTIAVGAITDQNVRAPYSDYGDELDVLAPGSSVQSTIDGTWVEDICEDTVAPDTTVDGYGYCTGTSMSAPHITGLMGLIRSLDPLLNVDGVKQAIFDGAQYLNKLPGFGYGVSDADKTIDKVLGVVGGSAITNRLTPLFSFYSSAAQDSFYTTVPQMAVAAFKATLQPQPNPSGAGSAGPVSYVPAYGVSTPRYFRFPHHTADPDPAPRAEVYIFTTDKNPLNGAQTLVPLYRMSYVSGNNNSQNVDHAYANSKVGTGGVDAYVSQSDYKLDGIEGYIFSPSYPKPANTEKLYRYWHPTRDDHAIFPESKLNEMVNAGYAVAVPSEPFLGYVYLNEDSDNDELIDGFEDILGTCKYDADTDNLGATDGFEVIGGYPRHDPKNAHPGCDGTLVAELPWRNNVVGTRYPDIQMNYALGYHFTPQANGFIEKLGASIFGTQKTIKLFDTATGDILAENTTNTINGTFKYVDVTDVPVHENVQYTVAVYLGSDGGAGWRTTGANYFPQTFDNITIDAFTYIETTNAPNARPTVSNLNGMIGEADVKFMPSKGSVVSFHHTAPGDYGTNQNSGPGSVIADAGGGNLDLTGNRWQYVPLNYTITSDTVLKFDYESTIEGDIHAIGMDDDFSLDAFGLNLFQLHGPQSLGWSDYKNYVVGSGKQTYEIPIGQFYTGQKDYVVFVMDDDVSPINGESTFTNVQIYEN